MRCWAAPEARDLSWKLLSRRRARYWRSDSVLDTGFVRCCRGAGGAHDIARAKRLAMEVRRSDSTLRRQGFVMEIAVAAVSLLIGLACGYGARAWVSRWRRAVAERAAAERRYRERQAAEREVIIDVPQSQYLTLEDPRK